MYGGIVHWIVVLHATSYALDIKLSKTIVSPTRLQITCSWSDYGAKLVVFYKNSIKDKVQNALQIHNVDLNCDVRTALQAECSCENSTSVACYINAIHDSTVVDQWQCAVPIDGMFVFSNNVTVRKEGPAIITNFFVNEFERLSNVSLVENDTAVFHCNGEGFPKPEMQIVKDLSIIEYYHENLTNITSVEIYHLISPVLYNHSGRYTCVANNNFGESRKDLNLDVLYPVRRLPNVDKDLYHDNTVIIPLHEDVLYMFHVTANPLPHPTNFTWFKCMDTDKCDEINVTSKVAIEYNVAICTIYIGDITESDYGRYVLRVSNGIGSTFTDSFKLQQFKPPTVSSFDSMNIKEGQSVNQSCKYQQGYPPDSEVRWLKDNVTITNNTLLIEDATRMDAGIYTCEVSNRITSRFGNFTGLDRGNFQIHVLYPATIHTFYVEHYENVLNITLKENDEAIFNCIGDGYPEPLIRILKGNKQLKASHGKDKTASYNIFNLIHKIGAVTCGDIGNYSCLISNSFGVRGQEINVNVFCPVKKLLNYGNEFFATLHTNVTFSFYSMSNPLPNRSDFSWRKCTEANVCVEMESNDRVQIETYGSNSTLTIYDITETDYGMYILLVGNGIGKQHTEVFYLKRPSYILLIVSVSTTSVFVSLLVVIGVCLFRKNRTQRPKSENTIFEMVETEGTMISANEEQTIPKQRSEVVYYEIHPSDDPILLADVSFRNGDLPEDSYPTTADHGRYESLIRNGQEETTKYNALVECYF